VCADGSVLVCARTGALLEQTPIPLVVATAATRTLCDHALAPFVLTHDTVHCEDSGRAHASWVSVWSLEMTVHARLLDAPAWQERESVAFAVGIGARDRAEAACAALDRDHGAHVEVASFRVSRPGEHWAVLARPRGASKGAALAKLAEKLGVAREHAAVVGDWYNDVSMFRWAGRSFAMGQAPAAVQAVASETLVATSTTGGGVAEAVERWLEGTRRG
jgi:hydroxymethylpyrimidine pyrophosphatase-like HAD family hydrolase